MRWERVSLLWEYLPQVHMHALFFFAYFYVFFEMPWLAVPMDKLLTGSLVYIGGGFPFGGLPVVWLFFLGKQIRHCLWIFYVRPSVSPENNPAVFYLIVSVLKARWFQLNLLLLLSNLGFTFAFHWLRCPCNWTPLVSFLQRTKLEIGYGGGHFLVLKEFV